jgi:protoporphyrinogen oxidase
MKAILDGMPNFYLAGNSFDGIGIPDCIRSGRVAAEKILRS